MRVYVGIDGGATRSTALATDGAGNELAREQGEAGIVHSLDPAGGAAPLVRLVRRVAERAGAGDAPAAALCCALAGAGREPERLAMEEALQAAGIALRVRVVGDAAGAMADAFGDGPGILLIAGTGSIAWARDAQGRLARAGGWGLLLGDEGSGYALGLAALRAVARAHDGRRPPTSLTSAVLRQTGLPAAEGLIAWVAAAGKADIATLAPRVFEAAAAGDEAAAAILAEAATALAGHVDALRRRLGPWPEPPTLAFAGSLITPGGPLRERLAAACRAIAPLRLLERAVDAARGAAGLARELDEAGG